MIRCALSQYVLRGRRVTSYYSQVMYSPQYVAATREFARVVNPETYYDPHVFSFFLLGSGSELDRLDLDARFPKTFFFFFLSW